MIIIRMTGGLGNQMFQYALYLKLSSMGKEVKFDDINEYLHANARPIMLWAFGIDYPKATKEEVNQITDGFMNLSHRIRRKLFGRKSLEYSEKDCNFDELVLQKEPAYLTGYFQSEQYFADIEKEVRSAFTLSPVIFESISTDLRKQILDYEAQIATVHAVSLHIRRGDYLDSSEIYGGNCTQEYYEKAISLIKQKASDVVFFVFSNDEDWAVNWCKEQAKKTGSSFVPIRNTPEEKGYLDLYLMSKCKEHIVANSSFSWWGAYLNPDKNKCVIAPARWFNNQDCRDIYTRGMIRITAEGNVLEP